MGGQLYTVFRPSVPEAQPPDDVRALYLHLDEADRLAREIGVTPLGNFLSAAVVFYIESRRFLIRDSPRPATTYEQKTGGADGVKGA